MLFINYKLVCNCFFDIRLSDYRNYLFFIMNIEHVFFIGVNPLTY